MSGYIVDQQTQISNNPGAWMFDGTSSNRFPILHSASSINNTNMILTDGTSYLSNDIDDVWFVLPGYKCEVYQHGGYGGIVSTYDNTYGTTVLVKKSSRSNDASSVKLFFKGTQL
mgnify:CR=1 FL=1